MPVFTFTHMHTDPHFAHLTFHFYAFASCWFVSAGADMSELQHRDFAKVSVTVAQEINRIRQNKNCCLHFPALEIFLFNHCLLENLGAFKVFRYLPWQNFTFCISSSLENGWQDKFFLITKGNRGLVTFCGHPCNITAWNCSQMWTVEVIKIAEGETGLTNKMELAVW